jgi:hypothetical protein
MKKIIGPIFIGLFLCLFLGVSPVQAADVQWGVNVNVGSSSHPYSGPPVYIEQPPVFIHPPQLGFYIAVGIPYDIFYLNNVYYMSRGNNWYRAPGYNGPWGQVHYKQLPWGIRQHKHQRIVMYRDREYKKYQQQRYKYHGRYFRPARHDVRDMRDDRRHDDNDRRDGRGGRPDDRRDQRR